MTAGSVLFAGTSGLISQDNANLFWDDTNNRLGIGNNAPTTLFHVGTSTSFVKITTRWQSGVRGAWIDVSMDGPSALGSNGPGNVPWIAYTFNNGNWFSNSQAGDICYRASGALLFGNSGGNAAMSVQSDRIGMGLRLPTSLLHITAGTLSNTGSQNGLHLTATIPATYSYQPRGLYVSITSSGSQNNSSFFQRASQIELLAGYTGTIATEGLIVTNASAGTANSILGPNVSLGNSGIIAQSNATTTGTNIGASGLSYGGNISVGGIFRAGNTTASFNKNAAKYIGCIGIARNDTAANSTSTGGYFGLNTSAPTFENAALIADNADAAYPIFLARDNGTTKWSIADGGDTTWGDAVNMVFNTTTGTKIGTSTTQKLAFWNAAPIVQPTTAVAAATRVGGGGTTVTDTDTFDGYTIAQVVKALRNTGLLA